MPIFLFMIKVIPFIYEDLDDLYANTYVLIDEKNECVVVDPPRKGMDEKAVDAVASIAPERIVYVSCNPATLARDIQRFNAYEYILKEAVAVDMFPRTSHVETVCYLYHQKKDFISVPYEPKDTNT